MPVISQDNFSAYIGEGAGKKIELAIDRIQNSKHKHLLIKKNGLVNFANPLTRLIEKIKGLFACFGAVDRTEKNYIKRRIIALLEHGIKNKLLHGDATRAKIESIKQTFFNDDTVAIDRVLKSLTETAISVSEIAPKIIVQTPQQVNPEVLTPSPSKKDEALEGLVLSENVSAFNQSEIIEEIQVVCHSNVVNSPIEKIEDKEVQSEEGQTNENSTVDGQKETSVDIQEGQTHENLTVEPQEETSVDVQEGQTNEHPTVDQQEETSLGMPQVTTVATEFGEVQPVIEEPVAAAPKEEREPYKTPILNKKVEVLSNKKSSKTRIWRIVATLGVIALGVFVYLNSPSISVLADRSIEPICPSPKSPLIDIQTVKLAKSGGLLQMYELHNLHKTTPIPDFDEIRNEFLLNIKAIPSYTYSARNGNLWFMKQLERVHEISPVKNMDEIRQEHKKAFPKYVEEVKKRVASGKGDSLRDLEDINKIMPIENFSELKKAFYAAASSVK